MQYKDIKQLEESGCIEDAKQLYLQEIEKGNISYYISGFFRCCKSLNQLQEFIEVYEKNPNFINDESICNQYGWAIYNEFIKNYDKDNLEELLVNARKIISVCQQPSLENYNANPFVLTIIKVVKKLKEKNNPSFKTIKEWITLLDLDKLKDDNEFKYKDSDGFDRENPSHKEFYIQTLSKCYEKLGEYRECVKFCEKALSLGIKWHYKNQRWIKARLLFCQCMVAEDYDVALENYKKLVLKNKFWYMYHKLSKLFFRKPDINSALLFECYALDIKEDPKMLVNVYEQLAYLCQAEGKIEEMKKFAQAAYYYRNLNSWNISDELYYLVELYELNSTGVPNMLHLKKICNDIIIEKEGLLVVDGKVRNFTKNHLSGFILSNELSKDVFFNLSDVEFNGHNLEINDVVNFKVIKVEKGLKAIAIKIKGVKNVRNYNK